MKRRKSKARLRLQQAAYWHLRLRDGSLEEVERKPLVAWLKQSPENVAAILKMSEIDRLCRERDVWSVVQGSPDFPAFQESTHSQSEQRAAVSTAYLEHLRATHHISKWALGLTGVGFVGAALLTSNAEMLALSTTSLALLGIFYLKEWVLKYRVTHGFYGSNAAEARDLVQFIIEHGDDLDFTDGNGLRRPSLVSHPDDRTRSPGEIPLGATAK